MQKAEVVQFNSCFMLGYDMDNDDKSLIYSKSKV